MKPCGTTPGSSQDGTFVVQAGDSLNAAYHDRRTTTGSTATVTASLEIIGGENGVLAVDPASIIPTDTITVTVTDGDLTGDSIDVLATSSTGEIETVSLDRVTDGEYSGPLDTIFGTTRGADNDGPMTVQAGDTLIKIARKHYGSEARWEDIYEANKSAIGSDPADLKVGMKLTLPAKKS